MFVQLSDSIFNKIIFIILAIGLDLFSQYVVALSKMYYRRKIYLNAILLFTVYCFYASVVVVSTIGFAIGEVGLKDKTYENVNLKEVQTVKDIQTIEHEIIKLDGFRSGITNYNWRFREISSKISRLQQKKTELQMSLSNKAEVNITKDVYDTLGKSVNISGNTLKIYTFLIIAIFLVVALLITSWDLEDKPKEKVTASRPELIRYIDAMLDGRQEGCNSDTKISEMIKMPLHECNKYRDILSNMKVGGKPILEKRQGGTRLLVEKEKLKEAIMRA
jgi:hypothetical protein